MCLPLPFVIAMLVTGFAYFCVSAWSLWRTRHHDHLRPNTPRRPRG